MYERKALEFVDKLKAEALAKDDPQLVLPDPLEFWLSQVELLLCFEQFLYFNG